MQTLTCPLHLLRRLLAALLVLSVLALQTHGAAAQADEAADTARWLVLSTGSEGAEEGGVAVTKSSVQQQGNLGAHDPPCWGEIVDQSEVWRTPDWLSEAPRQAACPAVKLPALAMPERPPRA